MQSITGKILFSLYMAATTWGMFGLVQTRVTSIPSFLLIVGAWIVLYGGILAAARYFRRIADETVILAVFTPVAFLFLLLVVESAWLQQVIQYFVTGLIGIIFYWHLSEQQPLGLSFQAYRRYQTMIITANAFAVIAFFSALRQFAPVQATISIVSFHLIGAILLGALAFFFWQLYYDTKPQLFTLWSVVVALITFEMSWVVALLPYGYLVNALIVTWLWYIIVLLIRFHIHERGIVWRKQRWFLGGNIIVFAMFFFFIFRWV